MHACSKVNFTSPEICRAACRIMTILSLLVWQKVLCLLQVYKTWEIHGNSKASSRLRGDSSGYGLRKGWVVSTKDPINAHAPGPRRVPAAWTWTSRVFCKEDGNIWNSLREAGGDSRRRQRISLWHSHHSTDTQRRKWSAKCVQSEPFRFEEWIHIYIYIYIIYIYIVK